MNEMMGTTWMELDWKMDMPVSNNGPKKEHQHVNKKEQLSAAFQIRDDPILGRHLLASRDFSAGELILREQPLVSGPNFCQEGLPVCLSCYSLVKSPHVCSTCRWPLCNSLCEKDSKHAALECPIFSSNSVSPDQLIGAESITILRCLLLKEKSPISWTTLCKFESHQEARTENPEAMTSLCDALTFIQQICGLERFDYDLIDMVTGVVHVNVLGAEDQQGALLYRYGSYLYETGSLLAHSCIPNAHRLINLHSELEVYAAVPIKKGDIIWTTYGESLIGTKERNQIMNELYYFSCSCTRCLDPTESSSFIQAIKCNETKACQTNPYAYLLPTKPLDVNSEWKCEHCGKIQEDRYVSTLKESFREDAEQIGSDRSVEKVLKLEELAGKHRSVVFHPNHFLILQIEYDIVQRMSYIFYKNKLIRFQVEFIQRFIQLTRKILSIFDIILPGFNRHRGRLLYFLQQGLLYQIQYKLNPNCKKRVDSKAISEVPKEFQEFLAIRKEGLMILAVEPKGSEESLLANEMTLQSQELDELKCICDGLIINPTNNNEIQQMVSN